MAFGEYALFLVEAELYPGLMKIEEAGTCSS